MQSRPLCPALYAISVRRLRTLPAASFGFHLTMDTLAVRLTLPTTKRVVDFHHQAIAHGGRTTQAGHRQNGDALRFCYSKQEVLPFSPDPPVVSAVLADRDAPCHHLVAPGRRTLSLPLRLLRPNHRQEQQLERPYPPANQQPPRQTVARSPAFANQLHPHVTAAAAWTFHAKHTLSFVDLHPLYRMYAAFAITFPAFRTARVFPIHLFARYTPPSLC